MDVDVLFIRVTILLFAPALSASALSPHAAKKSSKTVTIGAYPRRIIPLRRLCPIEASFISAFLPFFHSHLVIYLLFFGSDNERAAHYIVSGLARDPLLNLRWNSSELSDEQGPFFRVIDWSKNYFLFFLNTEVSVASIRFIPWGGIGWIDFSRRSR